MGRKAKAMKPSTEFPHPSPSLVNKGRPARGSNAPTTDCETLLAARADAEYLPNVSTRYMLVTIYKKRSALLDDSKSRVRDLLTLETYKSRHHTQGE